MFVCVHVCVSSADCWKGNFSINPHVRLSVGWVVGPVVSRLDGWLVGWSVASVCHNFQKRNLIPRYRNERKGHVISYHAASHVTEPRVLGAATSK